MLTVATLLWKPNVKSQSFSRCYDTSWVDKLCRGFRRHLTLPFEFFCLVDRDDYRFDEDVTQLRIRSRRPDYSTCIEPFQLDIPMILCGLDTVVTGNCDALAQYCMREKIFALPRDPYRPAIACNGVALVPAGHRRIATQHTGENDMKWVRRFPHRFIDDRFPGQVVSFKGHVKRHGLGDARIVYFHGKEKPHELQDDVGWISEHWS